MRNLRVAIIALAMFAAGVGVEAAISGPALDREIERWAAQLEQWRELSDNQQKTNENLLAALSESRDRLAACYRELSLTAEAKTPGSYNAEYTIISEPNVLDGLFAQALKSLALKSPEFSSLALVAQLSEPRLVIPGRVIPMMVSFWHGEPLPIETYIQIDRQGHKSGPFPLQIMTVAK